MTFETFDQRDEETWPDYQKDNDKDKYNDNDNDKHKHKENDKDMTWLANFHEIVDSADSWAYEFVTWHSRVTLDSIGNSCDV